MRITVSLHGVLRRERFKEKDCHYPSGSNVQMIINDLKIPEQLLGIILINGTHAGADDKLNDGDSLMLLPLLEGG
ncbi:MAG: MoaD/ThiS family protein [Desulfuromonadales bacterium]|nr:MoaD/ThiS family protein [Desulfuromonadales bacterium]MBN2793416.1 MoaD/ThiS family protein [Desulfuromonadales bacterium]